MTKKLILTAIATGILVSGCGTAGDAGGETEPPHGYVEGAEEAAEPQRRLVLADDSGSVLLLDPVSEKTTELDRVAGLRHLDTDGRFVFAETGKTVTVLDSGVWTVDHGDHRHYYRAEPRTVGDVDAGTGITVVGDSAVTVLNSKTGVTVLDRPALEKGEVDVAAKLSAAAALPFGERLLAVDADGTVEVLDRTGDTESTLEATCPKPRNPAVTQRGAVFGCHDGALLITDSDGEPHAEKIAYPGSAETGPTGRFGHRPGTPLLGAVTETGEALVLDLAEGDWIEPRTPDAVAVAGLGEDLPVLVLTEDGKLRAVDPATGEQTADRTIMDPIADGDPVPVIRADTERAYLTGPKHRTVFEIDYADDLRVAREFDLDFGPAHLTETGW